MVQIDPDKNFTKDINNMIVMKKLVFLSVMVSFILTTNLYAQETEPDKKGTIETKVDDKSDNKETEKTPIPLEQIRSFADIFTRIKLNYVEEVSDETLLEYAVEGMLSGLDPHSIYLKEDRFEQLNEGTTGAFSGLGMEVIMEGGFVKVVAPIDDTPADEAGIETGDLIIRMDGKTVSGLNLNEATELMRGAPGTSITLTILRETEPDPFDVVLKRAVVRLSSVKRKRLSKEIGYIRITQFQLATAENFRRDLKMLRESKGFSGLILDLRNNPGGLLTLKAQCKQC